MHYFKLLILATVLMCSQVVHAVESDRQGFIMGMGAGLHQLDVDFNYDGSYIGSDSKSGLATSFKIGWGFTNQLSIYYVRNASWYSAAVSSVSSNEDTTFTIGLAGIGATLFLQPSAPSWYILGAFGVGDISAPFESQVESDTGSALMFGGGYEISDHVQIELTVLSTDIDSADDALLNLESSSTQLTLNYLWY